MLNNPDHETVNSGWKSFYILGGIAALIPVFIGAVDILLTFAPGSSPPTAGSDSVIVWFTLLQNNWVMGLRGLGLGNVIVQILTVPLFLALYAVLRRTNQTYAALAALIFFIGATLYIANNSALAMLNLSGQYATATSASQKSLCLAAGQALLAQAEDFTPGAFMGFFIPEVAGLMMAGLMLRSKIFSKLTAWVGILGFALLLVQIIWGTFVLVWYEVTVLVATAGGLLGMAWYIMLARKFFQLGWGVLPMAAE